MIKISIGDRIRIARENKNLSQRQLARLAKLNVYTLNRIEKGKRELRFSEATVIVVLLGITLEDLIN